MPLLNGIDTAAELRANGQDVPIIFLTSSREFAVESYEVKAFHYLLKPIDEIRLFAVMDEYRKQFCKIKETFTAQTVTGFYKMTIEEVACLEAQNKLVLVTFSTERRSQSVNHFISAKRYSIWIGDLSSVIAAIS